MRKNELTESQRARKLLHAERALLDYAGTEALAQVIYGRDVKEVHEPLLKLRDLLIARTYDSHATIDSEGRLRFKCKNL